MCSRLAEQLQQDICNIDDCDRTTQTDEMAEDFVQDRIGDKGRVETSQNWRL